MNQKIRFKRSIFEKFPWLNLVMTIAVTILEITMAIVDTIRGKYIWSTFFILTSLIYVFFMIPMSYRIMKHTIQNNKNMKDLEKRIAEAKMKEIYERRKDNENLSKL